VEGSKWDLWHLKGSISSSTSCTGHRWKVITTSLLLFPHCIQSAFHSTKAVVSLSSQLSLVWPSEATWLGSEPQTVGLPGWQTGSKALILMSFTTDLQPHPQGTNLVQSTKIPDCMPWWICSFSSINYSLHLAHKTRVHNYNQQLMSAARWHAWAPVWQPTWNCRTSLKLITIE